MKLVNYLGLGLLSVGVLVGLSGQVVSAAEVVGQTQETPIGVTIKDGVDTTDPLDPTDPNQKMLNLTKVPTQYNFETTVKNTDYTIDGTVKDGSIVVFNDRSSREWSVKATVKNDELTVSDKTVSVTSFKINKEELVGSGAKGIVAKAADDKTVENNTGAITTDVSEVAIGFSDTANVVKVGSTLAGTISYQLYNTADAK